MSTSPSQSPLGSAGGSSGGIAQLEALQQKMIKEMIFGPRETKSSSRASHCAAADRKERRKERNGQLMRVQAWSMGTADSAAAVDLCTARR